MWNGESHKSVPVFPHGSLSSDHRRFSLLCHKYCGQLGEASDTAPSSIAVPSLIKLSLFSESDGSVVVSSELHHVVNPL